MAAQLTIDGREVQPAPPPEQCETLALFTAPPTIRGQLAALSLSEPVQADRAPDPCPGASQPATCHGSATSEPARCTSPADPVHRARMDAGRERAQRERELRSCERVETFRAWLAAGSPAREIPEVPRDADFATARAHGRDRAS